MDAVGLTVLSKEMEADCAVIQDAARKARVRLSITADGRLEACAYELARPAGLYPAGRRASGA